MMRTLSITVLIVIVAFVSPVLAQDSESEWRTLAGLKGVQVVVAEMSADAEREGLSQTTLQTDVEVKLRQAGIRVLTRTESNMMPGQPYLYLNVATIKLKQIEAYCFHIKLQLIQGIILERALTITSLATTWEARGAVGLFRRPGLSKVREAVRDEVNQFINAYLAANPKR